MDFEKEEIAAIYVNDQLFCAGCTKNEDWNDLTRDRVITRKEAEEKINVYFCDMCGEPI